MKLAKISIIIPVFNAINTIENSLESVVNQTYPNVELIVIDGKSTDGTIDILKSYTNKIDHLVIEKDRGVYSAMNKGIELAKGDFLYFLGADDNLASLDIMSQLFSNSIDQSLDIIFGHVENINTENNKIPKFHQSEFSRKIRWKNTLHHQGAFYRSSIFNDFRYDESLQVLADYELNITLLNSNTKTLNTNKTIAVCSGKGISKEFVHALYKEELKIKKRHFSTLGYWIQIPWVWMKYLYKQL